RPRREEELGCDFFDFDALHYDIRDWTITGLRRCLTDFSNHIHTLNDFSEHRMPVIQVRRRGESDEELAAVRVWSGVRHGQNAFGGVLQLRVKLVGKLISRSASSGSC